MGVDAGARRADLALVREDPGRGTGDRRRQVRVREDDVGGLAAQLDTDPLDGFGGVAQHQSAHRRRSRERDLVDARVGDQRVARPGASGHHAQDTLGQPGVAEQRGEPQGGERRLLGRLQDHAAPGRERRGDLLHGQEEWVVPRRDGRDDADGLVQHDRQRGGRDGVGLPGCLGRPARVVVEDPGRLGDVPLRLGQRLADVLALQPCPLVGLLAQQLRCPGEHPAALVVRSARPPAAGVERGTGAGDRDVDGGLVHVLDRGDLPGSRRVEDRDLAHPRTSASRAAARPVRTAPSMYPATHWSEPHT